jgi:hypothetical protein
MDPVLHHQSGVVPACDSGSGGSDGPGTINSAHGGSLKVDAADGSTSTIAADYNADGSTTINESSDGNAVTTYAPDGTVTALTTAPDHISTTVETHPDGSKSTTVTMQASASGAVSTASTGVDGATSSESADGKTSMGVVADGSTATTTVDADGTVAITAADGITTTADAVANDDGNTTSTLADNSAVGVIADGNTMMMPAPDGTVTATTTNEDGSITKAVTRPNGSTSTVTGAGEGTDGSYGSVGVTPAITKTAAAEGSATTLSADGKTIASASVAADGSSTKTHVDRDAALNADDMRMGLSPTGGAGSGDGSDPSLAVISAVAFDTDGSGDGSNAATHYRDIMVGLPSGGSGGDMRLGVPGSGYSAHDGSLTVTSGDGSDDFLYEVVHVDDASRHAAASNVDKAKQVIDGCPAINPEVPLSIAN